MTSYHVYITEIAVYTVEVEAPDTTTAETNALAAFERDGCLAFPCDVVQQEAEVVEADQ